MSAGRWSVPLLFGRWASRLRFPRLVLLMGGLFVADLIIPDGLPLIDELMLAAATALLASLRRDDAEKRVDRDAS